MSVAALINREIQSIREGEPFTTGRFLKLGSRSAIDKALSRLVKDDHLERVSRGVFVRPKKSRFVGKVMPDVSQVLEVIAEGHGETIQVHGAEAARRFKISTQMPTQPVYYTNGPSRELRVGMLKVRLMHTTSHRRLQHAGKKTGLALSALWYLGKEQVNSSTIQRIREGLSSDEFETLRMMSMPGWMTKAIETYRNETRYA